MRRVEVESLDQRCEEFTGASQAMYKDNRRAAISLFLVVEMLPIYRSETSSSDSFGIINLR